MNDRAQFMVSTADLLSKDASAITSAIAWNIAGLAALCGFQHVIVHSSTNPYEDAVVTIYDVNQEDSDKLQTFAKAIENLLHAPALPRSTGSAIPKAVQP